MKIMEKEVTTDDYFLWSEYRKQDPVFCYHQPIIRVHLRCPHSFDAHLLNDPLCSFGSANSYQYCPACKTIRMIFCYECTICQHIQQSSLKIKCAESHGPGHCLEPTCFRLAEIGQMGYCSQHWNWNTILFRYVLQSPKKDLQSIQIAEKIKAFACYK